MSVDPIETSRSFAAKLGLTFTVASDPAMKVIDAWGVRNQDVPALALHSVFMVDRAGEVFYRKIARRRVRMASGYWKVMSSRSRWACSSQVP